MEIESVNMNETNEIKEVISLQSETSILKKASDQIKALVQSNCISTKNKEIQNEIEENSKESSVCNILRTKLHDQISTGEITPFAAEKKVFDNKQILGTVKKPTQLLDFEKYLLQQAELSRKKQLLKRKKTNENLVSEKKIKVTKSKSSTIKKNETMLSKKSYSNKRESIASHTQISTDIDLSSFSDKIVEKNKCNINSINLFDAKNSCDINKSLIIENINEVQKISNLEIDDKSGSEYVPSDENDSEVEMTKQVQRKKKYTSVKKNSIHLKRVLDDGDEKIYKQRVEQNYQQNEPLHNIDHVFKVPKCIWKRLYKYQKVSVKWLWELHTRSLGGLLGDEMGLGKTVQVIAFLAGLDCSELLSDGGRFRGLGPTLIVCPATLLEQWVKHFHEWWPILRIIILHQSGTFQGNIEHLLHSLQSGGILVTSYSGVLIHKDWLLNFKWHYVILDEGHKIRNPEAKISKIVKGFLTPHRLLLTGSPMQNSLKELWSLFNFILPGKLGTLPAFMEHCAGPITKGGYTNATRLQEATALQVATMLKDAITPYMLRRTKYDIQHHINLPDKSEQVLFCSLTEEQRKLYKEFLRSGDVSFVLHEKREGLRYKARLLVALTALRKICNHPDLYLYSKDQEESDAETEIEVNENEMVKFGYWKRSGKMTVVRSLLQIWNKQKHRVLLFTQSRQMMHILESLVQKEKYTYLRMDGTTPMSHRQLLISKFNKDQSYFVFLLTTRVGGLGVNLTGANRVIIYDPDWNPATDAQARERAWRIGQDKSVTIYRLITAGTIEEKIYHRQVFKILLSNKVLEDPKQRRLFRTTDLTELFNLNEPIDGKSESDKLFQNSSMLPNKPNFSLNKIEAMKKLASALSKKIAKNSMQCQSTQEKCTDNNKLIDKNNAVSETETSNLINKSSNLCFVEESKNFSVKSESNSTDTNKLCNSNIENFPNINDDKNIIDNDNQENNCLKMNENELLDEFVTIKTKEEEQEFEKSDNICNVPKFEQTSQDELEEGEISDSELPTKPNIINIKNSIDSTKICKKNRDDKINTKHRKHKKRKSKETISAMFEGQRVSCLIGRRLNKSKESYETSISDDQFVLSKLFSKSAVSSAVEHESVLSNAALYPEQETPLQKVAKETASEKMDSMRQSRKWCWKPCWDKPPEDFDYDNR